MSKSMFILGTKTIVAFYKVAHILKDMVSMVNLYSLPHSLDIYCQDINRAIIVQCVLPCIPISMSTIAITVDVSPLCIMLKTVL